jgi:hypothetical protein
LPLGSDLLPAFNHIDMFSYREEELRLLEEYKERMFNKDFTAQSATLAASCDKNSAIEHVTEHSEDAEWARRLYLLQDESIKACLDARHTTVKSSRDEPR